MRVEFINWFYYVNDTRVTGWRQFGTSWAWFHPNGAMATGDVWIDGVLHRFNDGGAWQGQV